MVKHLETGVEVKKVDSQGRLILPVDWREAEIGESRELYVIKRKGYLKLVPKRRVDLTEFFDKVDLGVDSIGNWAAFEKRIYEEVP
jgi:bifunctional DNA-binding transcriptional regulator/antitoxin component of YhaV-PrlF toxin-antitoxin module